MEKPNLIIYGRVIALSDVQEIPSSDPQKPAMKKRLLYMDCTRYDSITGERMDYENKPLLEFGGDKVLEKLEDLKLQKGDVVCVKFDIRGNQSKDKTTGKPKVFTSIRCYECDVVRRAAQPAAQPTQQPQQAAAPAASVQQPIQTSQDGKDGLPF